VFIYSVSFFSVRVATAQSGSAEHGDNRRLAVSYAVFSFAVCRGGANAQ